MPIIKNLFKQRSEETAHVILCLSDSCASAREFDINLATSATEVYATTSAMPYSVHSLTNETLSHVLYLPLNQIGPLFASPASLDDYREYLAPVCLVSEPWKAVTLSTCQLRAICMLGSEGLGT